MPTLSFAQRMIDRARSSPRGLVLPEGTEPRTLRAARRLVDEHIASSVTLVGSPGAVRAAAECEGVSLRSVGIVDPATSVDRERFVQEYHVLRKHKGVDLEEAARAMGNPLCWGSMMVRLGQTHAMVAGAESSTADVLRAAIPIIGTTPGTKLASSCFVMVVPDCGLGADGYFIFSDCAIVPDPSAEQLAEIAMAAAASCRALLGVEPVVAMLSFSTKGSASHPSTLKVIEALRIVRERAPGLVVDGEMQADAALVSSVGAKKAPGSPVAGRANTLVFPELNSANIGYKLVHRLGRAEAYGPFLQGFAKPVSDLSRGCSADEIVVTCAATLVRAG